MTFSWDNAKKNALDTKIRRAKTMAKLGENSDFKLAHVDWVREAQTGNYKNLEIKIKDKTQKAQALAIARRLKNA